MILEKAESFGSAFFIPLGKDVTNIFSIKMRINVLGFNLLFLNNKRPLPPENAVAL